MAHGHGESELRGGLAAAAAILGVPIELHDGPEWGVEDGVARVGLRTVRDAGLRGDDAAAWVLLLLWESVREVRHAPERRRRRNALSTARPDLEPLLAAIDRLLAASELLTALPNFRLETARALQLGAIESPGELPRHLQWVEAIIDAVATRWKASTAAVPPSLSSLAPEVVAEFVGMESVGGQATGDVLARVFAVGPGPSPMSRFERAFGVLAPPYERLLALDRSGRGPQSDGRGEDAPPEGAGQDAPGWDSGGGGLSEDPEAGGDAGETTAEQQENARSGDSPETAEGADLFAAEQAGFVAQMLATPLPASGTWADGQDLPDAVAQPGPEDSSARPFDGRTGDTAAAGETGLDTYRARTRMHAESIDRVREVWRRIVADRVHERRTFSRVAEPDGERLDRRALVQIVADTTAGVERPRAFIRRETRPLPSRRTGSTDYVLLVDRSASMQGAPAAAAATASLIMLEGLAGVERDIRAEERARGIEVGPHLRTALIVFDSTPVVVKPLAGSLDDRARRALDAAIHAPRGSTNDAAALRAAREELGILGGEGSFGAGGGLERRRVVMLVSDGGTNDAAAARAELGSLRAAGAAVFGIGIQTDDLRVRFAPDGIRLNRAEELPDLLERLVTDARLTT